MILAPRRVPTWAPNGPNIASKIIIGLEIYRNRLGEGSERAREAKKGSNQRNSVGPWALAAAIAAYLGP